MYGLCSAATASAVRPSIGWAISSQQGVGCSLVLADPPARGGMAFCSLSACLSVFLIRAFNLRIETRSSADADKPRDAFRVQSRSPNMVPFDMLSMVSY